MFVYWDREKKDTIQSVKKKRQMTLHLATSFVFWCHLDINNSQKYGIL